MTSPPLPHPPRPGRAPDAPPRRRTLNQELVVDAALRVLDAEGLDGLTMRRVGEELDTGGASLYAHVENKEAMLDLVLDRIYDELEVPDDPDPERWQEQVKEVVRSMRATLGAHRDVARASLARVPTGPNALRGIEALIGLLRAGGLADQTIAYACDLLPLYATAIAYEEGLYASRGWTPEDIGDWIGELRRFFSALPAERFPNIVALAVPLTYGSTEGDERFEFGLEVLVGGLAAMGARG